jgi:hypothetical protein
MTTKLKIDLSQGILEVEGSETFVKAIYRDFKVQFLGEEAVEDESQPTKRRRRRRVKASGKSSAQPAAAGSDGAKSEEVTATTTTETTSPSTEPAYEYLKDFDLTATKDHPSLVEFMDSKFPITNEERNLVFIYYLQYILKHKPIAPDHVYTCYRKAKIRAPLDLEHSLEVTAGQRKWIRIAKNGNITATAAGKKYLEEQLPKKTKR